MEQTDVSLDIIGSTELVGIAGIKDIPAKVDTGADTSAIWASNIDMRPDGTLTFTLFSNGSPFYTGDVLESTNYRAKRVRSSHGDQQIRYRVKLPITISGKAFETTFTLADRSRNLFPALIGRHTIEGRYLVDVSKSVIERKRPVKSTQLSKELLDNPYEFHQKYFNNNQKGKYENSDSI